MPFRRTHFLALLLCLTAVGTSSCVVRRRAIVRKAGTAKQALLTADKQFLISRVAQIYDFIRDFSATVDMTPALGTAEKNSITEYKDVRGYILFRKPADIRIIGLYPVVRNKAFDMVSNGVEFKLYVPAKSRFVVGRNDLDIRSQVKLENLRPQHFLDSMLVRPVQPDEEAVLANFTDEDNADYVLLLLKRTPTGQLRLSRAISFERFHLTLARQMVFDERGNILTDARYSTWQTWNGAPFPKQIEINRPQDEYAVVISVVKMNMNEGVSNDKFVLEQPPGSTLQVLGQKPAATPKPSPPPKAEKKK